MGKELYYNSEAREKLKVGIDKLADMVKITMGAQGRPVIISNMGQLPFATKDGVTVSKEIDLEDDVENAGAMLIKSVANKTATEVGDGTSTSIVLTQAIINSGMEYMNSNGGSAVDIKRGIDIAVETVVKYLKDSSLPVSGNWDMIKNVATISANNDPELGDLIVEALRQVGEGGYISIEPSRGVTTSIYTVEGMQFDKGMESPYFINNNEKLSAEHTDPLILICDFSIENARQIIPIMNKIGESYIEKKQQIPPLLLLADNFDASVLNFLVDNILKGGMQCIAVKTPEFGERKTDLLKDIAALTGGKVFSFDSEPKLQDAVVEDLGDCQRIKVTKNDTTIIGGRGNSEEIQNRVQEIDTILRTNVDEYDKKFLQLRKAKLSSGVAIISLGASSDIEMKEKLDRLDDAVHATSAAIEEGIIAGGGIAFIHASKMLDKISVENKSQQVGINIIKEAILAPAKQIIYNLKGSNHDEIIEEIMGHPTVCYGYDVKNEKFTDMIVAGVIDPLKVARLALLNSVSVASMFLLSEGLIIENLR